MKIIQPLGLAALCICLVTVHVHAADATGAKAADQPALTDDLNGAKLIPIADAIKTAVTATPGKATKVTLTAPSGKAVYAVEIPGTDGSVTTVLIDALGGLVAGNSVAYPAKNATEGVSKTAPPTAGSRKARGEKDDDD
jgi:hypothetical protein